MIKRIQLEIENNLKLTSTIHFPKNFIVFPLISLSKIIWAVNQDIMVSIQRIYRHVSYITVQMFHQNTKPFVSFAYAKTIVFTNSYSHNFIFYISSFFLFIFNFPFWDLEMALDADATRTLVGVLGLWFGSLSHSLLISLP